MALAMSRDDIRQFVWDSLESDVEELPTTLLDRFIYNGAEKLEQYSRAWTFRAVEYTLTTTPGVREYSLDLTPSLINPAPLADIYAIQGPSYPVKPASHNRMRQLFPTNADSTSNPTWFSTWGRTLFFWPKPSGVVNYTISGYRRGIDWVATNAAPDFPADLHELIAWWALNRAYLFLDTPDLAEFYRDEFDKELRIRARAYTGANDSDPLVMNGGTPGADLPPWRHRYDWES